MAVVITIFSSTKGGVVITILVTQRGVVVITIFSNKQGVIVITIYWLITWSSRGYIFICKSTYSYARQCCQMARQCVQMTSVSKGHFGAETFISILLSSIGVSPSLAFISNTRIALPNQTFNYSIWIILSFTKFVCWAIVSLV